MYTACGLLCFGVALADDQTEAARAGQDAGQALLGIAELPTFVDGGERGVGTLLIDSMAVPVNQLMPGGDVVTHDRLQSIAGDEDALATTANTHLAAQRDDPSDTADALRIVAALPITPPDEFLDSESFLARQSLRALTAPMDIAPEFPACRTETRFVDTVVPYTTWTERSCERIRPPPPCARAMQLVDASLPDHPVFDRVVVLPSDSNIEIDVDAGLSTASIMLSAHLNITWQGPAVGVDIVEAPDRTNGWSARLLIRPDPAACPSCSITLRVVADLRAVTQVFVSEPAECLFDSDAFCTAQFTCNESMAPVIGGTSITADEVRGLIPLYPSASHHLPPDALAPLCVAAHANYDCRFQEGRLCIDTPTGPRCTTNTQDTVVADTCTPMLQQFPDCRLSRRACTEGAEGAGGWCHVETETWRCPNLVTRPGVVIDTHQPCAGQIRCAGNDCMDRRFDEQGQHTLATGMAGMMLTQVLASDWQAAPDQRSGQTPLLLPGKPFECRKALGGAIDCCDETHTDAPRDWFDKYQRHLRRANATDALSRYAGEGSHGGWLDLASSTDWQRTQLDRPLTSGPETITTGTNAPSPPTPGSIVGQTRLLAPMNDEFIEDARYEHMNEVGWACSAREFDLANQREIGNCLSIGSYCAHNVFGACLDKRDVFCCFSSPASRVLRESIAGPEGVASGAFGTARAPRCQGIVTERADLSTVDLSDLEGRIADADLLPSAETLRARSSAERLTGSGSHLAHGYRPTTQQRTANRMSAIDGAGVRDALFDEASSLVPALVANDVPGQVSFAPAYQRITAGGVAFATVRRQGRKGAVTATVVVESGTAVVPALREILRWPAGDDSDRIVRIPIPVHVRGILQLRLMDATGGIRFEPNDSAIFDIVGP